MPQTSAYAVSWVEVTWVCQAFYLFLPRPFKCWSQSNLWIGEKWQNACGPIDMRVHPVDHTPSTRHYWLSSTGPCDARSWVMIYRALDDTLLSRQVPSNQFEPVTPKGHDRSGSRMTIPKTNRVKRLKLITCAESPLTLDLALEARKSDLSIIEKLKSLQQTKRLLFESSGENFGWFAGRFSSS